jgi:phosphoribosylformylglycinamidine synthase
MPKPGILDPQGRAVEQSLPHLDVRNVGEVRVGRRVELMVEAPDAQSARAVVERLASELFANPLIETWNVEAMEGARGGLGGVADAGGRSGVAEAAR